MTPSQSLPPRAQSPPRAPIPRAARMAADDDWECPPSDYAHLGKPLPRFSWLSPRILWASRNNVMASLTGDPTENARRAWVAERRAALAARDDVSPAENDFIIERDDLRDFSCMVIGDTGEGDVSQYAIVPTFLNAARGTEFTVIASDVVYPAGDVNEYIGKFFVPFAGYPRPIYAVPGNHDWLDGLVGFMRHFCGAEPPPHKFRPPRPLKYPRTVMLIDRLFWRRAGRLQPHTLAEAEALRGVPGASGPEQPNMYFCIDTPQLRLVCVDTGILGRLDADQGDWLRRVSAGDKPKLLITGKPIYHGPTVSPRRILPPEGGEAGGGEMMLSVLRDPAHNYLGLVAGDVHHYQRHPVRLADGRIFHSIISGGGGAFMSSTHQLGRVDLPDVDEDDWVVYPTRADSLRAYSVILVRKLRRLAPWLRGRPVRGIPADEATAILAKRHGLDLGAELSRGEREGAARGKVRVSLRSRVLAAMIYPQSEWFEPGRISEVLDWDEPPFFKNFLRLDVSEGRLTITAYGVSGCRRDENDPAVIDRVEIKL